MSSVVDNDEHRPALLGRIAKVALSINVKTNSLTKLPFLTKSEAYTFTLVLDQVLDILRHLSSDPLPQT